MIKNTVSNPLEELCIEITGKCGMNCAHCSSSCTVDNQNFVSFEKIKEIFNDAKLLGAQIIELSGGEPLLHPNINDIIELASKDFKVRLYTCGFLGNTNSWGIPKEQLELFSKFGLDRIIFNLQGATTYTHEKITGTKDSFKSVINSIKTAKANGLWTGVHFVPMKPNYMEFHAVVELCKELKVDELAVLRFVSQGRGKLNRQFLELSQEEFSCFLLEIVRLKREYDDLINIRTGCPMNFCSMIDRSIKPVRCKAGLSTLLINFDGIAVPCPAFKKAHEFELGNIYQESLISIWKNNHVLEQLRKFNFLEIDGCKDCNNLDYCQGRCIAQRFYEYGDIYQGPDPLCPYHKLEKETSEEDTEVFAIS